MNCKKPVLLAAAVMATLVPAPGHAQDLATDDPVLRRIWEEATARSQVEPLAQTLLDAVGPRLTGSPQSEQAQAWAVETLKGWGVDARLEQYGTWEGWDRGVKGMKVGGRRRLTIPPDLGYGSRGAGGVIKGGETLVFVVDLVAVR